MGMIRLFVIVIAIALSGCATTTHNENGMDVNSRFNEYRSAAYDGAAENPSSQIEKLEKDTLQEPKDESSLYNLSVWEELRGQLLYQEEDVQAYPDIIYEDDMYLEIANHLQKYWIAYKIWPSTEINAAIRNTPPYIPKPDDPGIVYEMKYMKPPDSAMMKRCKFILMIWAMLQFSMSIWPEPMKKCGMFL